MYKRDLDFGFQKEDNIEITEDIINQFELREGGRWDRGRPELNQYYYIPIEILTELK